jgi:plastocyanin
VESEPIVQTPGGGKKDLLLKALLFVVIPSLFVFIVITVYFLTRSGGTAYDSRVDKETSPWELSTKSSSSVVPTPKAAELDAKYKEIFDIVARRDYAAFKLKVSADIVWSFENPKKLVGETSDGIPVFEKVSLSGEKNFVRNSPYTVLFNAPNPEKSAPVIVEKYQPSPDEESFILVDTVTDERTKVVSTVWQNSVRLVYNDTGSSASRVGYAYFVWDAGTWKFRALDWPMSGAKESTGHMGFEGNTDYEVSYSESVGCDPSNLNIQAGEAVSWKDITGKIYTIDSSNAGHWDSGYMIDGSFSRLFKDKGDYDYVIVSPPTVPLEAKVCRIRVR